MRNRLTDELAVCGMNAVTALGEYHCERINRFFLRENRLPAFAGVCKKLAEQKLPYKLCEDEELERICKSTHHQGVVAMIEEPVINPMSREDLDFWSKEAKTGLILCSVGNDHNLGAIVRAAAFFDVHFVLVSEGDTEARLTTSAFRVAEGGMEHVEFRSVRNLAAFFRDASKALLTIGADPRARWRIDDLPAIVKDKGKAPRNAPQGSRPGMALALGNEETGLPQEVKDQCSALVRIPGTGNIESLNVAQAAALFLQKIYEL